MSQPSMPRAAAVLAAFAAITLQATPAAAGVGVGSRAPEIGLRDARGNRISMQAYRGKVVIVDVWASWCEPCKKELPALQKLYAQHFRKGLRVVGVNVDGDESAMKRFTDEHGVLFPNVHDPDKSVANRYGLSTMPSSYVVDHRGIVRYVNRGFRPGEERKIERQALDLLAKTPGGAEGSGEQAAGPGPGASDGQGEGDATGAGPEAAVADEGASGAAGPADAPPETQPGATGRKGGLCAVSSGSGARAAAVPLLLAALALHVRRRRVEPRRHSGRRSRREGVR